MTNAAESQTENPSDDKTAAKAARTFQPRERRRVDRRSAPPEALRNEFEYRKWELEREAEIAKEDQAYKGHPPGGKLYAQTRSLPTRRRAGIVFSNKGSVEVEIVDASDEDVAQAVINGRNVVTPMGAKAIFEDDALIVSDAPASKATVARVGELEAENEQLKAEIASLRGKRRETDADRVTPERLGKEKTKAGATAIATPPPAPTPTNAPASEADQILADAKTKQQNPTK